MKFAVCSAEYVVVSCLLTIKSQEFDVHCYCCTRTSHTNRNRGIDLLSIYACTYICMIVCTSCTSVSHSQSVIWLLSTALYQKQDHSPVLGVALCDPPCFVQVHTHPMELAHNSILNLRHCRGGQYTTQVIIIFWEKFLHGVCRSVHWWSQPHSSRLTCLWLQGRPPGTSPNFGCSGHSLLNYLPGWLSHGSDVLICWCFTSIYIHCRQVWSVVLRGLVCMSLCVVLLLPWSAYPHTDNLAFRASILE